ncbi:MAG: hypothetical protein EA368_05625 [Leptolyngbya sp. DLM2.Bin27]|nr:MAG: hypothetical protein EA368_05625 [Leptolyngbya sp. DLM2.Bin27]
MFPGLGSLIVGKVGQGLAQICTTFLVILIGIVSPFLFGLPLLIAVPLGLANLVWSILTVAQLPE